MTPQNPKIEPQVRKPEEAGATGGAPAEAKPPAASGEWIELELTTVNQYGEKVVRQLRDLSLLTFALNQAATHILMDTFEAVKEEVLAELPRPRIRGVIFGV